MLCNITIWSPVKTMVYLNNKDCLLMIIDPNSGFDYSYNSCGVNDEFTLYFEAKGFSKSARFETPKDGEFEWHLKDVLTPQEILDSYDRDEALKQIEVNPTGYAFTELGTTGLAEDIPLIKRIIATCCETRDRHEQYIAAKACSAIAEIADRNPSIMPAVRNFIRRVYEEYSAKDSYGYMIEAAIRSLT